MKAIFYREPFLAACQLAKLAVPSKDIKPVLKNLKLVVSPGVCTLTATDLEIGVCVPVEGVEIHEPGTLLLPVDRLIPILREASGNTALEVTADAEVIRIRGMATALDYELPASNPDEFPEVPTFGDPSTTSGGYHEVDAATLATMIRRTSFAVADESQRYSMTGLLWETEDLAVRLIGTDGRRLAVMPGAATRNGDHQAKHSPVVPGKAMSILAQQLGTCADGGMVLVRLLPNEALFLIDGKATLYSRLVEGRFPDWRQVMPKRCEVRLNMPVADLLQAVRQAAIMTDKEGPRVAFTFAPSKLTLEAKTGEANSGRSRVEMPIDFDGNQVVVNLNPEYVVEMLRVLPTSESVTVELIDGGSPVLFRCGEWLCLSMPMT